MSKFDGFAHILVLPVIAAFALGGLILVTSKTSVYEDFKETRNKIIEKIPHSSNKKALQTLEQADEQLKDLDKVLASVFIKTAEAKVKGLTAEQTITSTPTPILESSMSEAEKQQLANIFQKITNLLSEIETSIDSISDNSLLTQIYHSTKKINTRLEEATALTGQAKLVEGALSKSKNIIDLSIARSVIVSPSQAANLLSDETKQQVSFVDSSPECIINLDTKSGCLIKRTSDGIFFGDEKLTLNESQITEVFPTKSLLETKNFLQAKQSISYQQTVLSATNKVLDLNKTQQEYIIKTLAKSQIQSLSELDETNNSSQFISDAFINSYNSGLKTLAQKDPQTALEISTELITETLNKTDSANIKNSDFLSRFVEKQLETKDAVIDQGRSSGKINDEAIQKEVEKTLKHIDSVRGKNPNNTQRERIYKALQQNLRSDENKLKDANSPLYSEEQIRRIEQPLQSNPVPFVPPEAPKPTVNQIQTPLPQFNSTNGVQGASTSRNIFEWLLDFIF